MILQSENWQLNFVVNVNEYDVAVAFDQVHNTVTFDVYCFLLPVHNSAAQSNSMCTQCAVFVFLFNFNLTLIIQ